MNKSKSTGCTKCGSQSDIFHFDGCPELGINLKIINDEVLTFQKDGKKAYFYYKDGRWQFWGDLTIDESDKLLFNRFVEYISMNQEYKKAIRQQAQSEMREEIRRIIFKNDMTPLIIDELLNYLNKIK